MKKHIFLLTALIVGSQLLAESAAQKIIAFKEMKQTQKSEWMQHRKQCAQERKALRAHHHTAWMDLYKKKLQKFQELTDCSSEAKEKVFHEILHDMIALRIQHKKELKELLAKRAHEKKELCLKHEQEMQKFIEKNVPELATKESAGQPAQQEASQLTTKTEEQKQPTIHAAEAQELIATTESDDYDDRDDDSDVDDKD